jgi:hypothetical protein
MPEIRTILDEDILSLKGATEACFILGKGVTSFASMTRVGVSTLSKYASNSDEFRESLIPVDIAVEADRRAGSPIIIKEAARQLGFQLVPLQEALRSGTRISERDAHVILSEAMDVSRGLITAFEDGKIDALERKQLRKELRELIRAAEDILHRMDDE